MSDQLTQKVDNKFGKSIGAGLSALTGGGRDFYVLECRTNTAEHKAGWKQEIIVNYLEIGRDSKCAFRFTDADKFVSRKHCSIEKDGNNYFVNHLSSTNPTLLNGKIISEKTQLNSGDEIQLASDGPKLGFIVPANNKTGSLGFTRRLSLFGKQALRPYKQAVMLLSVVLLLGLGTVGYFIFRQSGDISSANEKIAGLNIKLKEMEKISAAQADSLKSVLQSDKKLMQSLTSQVKNIHYTAPVQTAVTSSTPINVTAPPPAFVDTIEGKTVTAKTDDDDWKKIQTIMNDVYYIYVEEVIVDDGKDVQHVDYGYSATGYLCADGKFITARHCTEPWFMIDPYDADESDLVLNANSVAGVKVYCIIHCVSPTGKKFDLNSADFMCDRSNDGFVKVEIDDQQSPVQYGSLDDGTDYAYCQTSYTGTIVADPDYSHNMHPGTLLTVLGYPLGLGADDLSHVSPMYSQTMVANYSSVEHNLLIVSNKNTDHGNSGGPLFALVNGEYRAVALVSGTYGSQDHFGRMVPVYNVFNFPSTKK